MEQLIEILEEIVPGIDYTRCEALVSQGYWDSLSIIAIIAVLEDAYDIMIPTVEIVPGNLDSAERIWEMVERLREAG